MPAEDPGDVFLRHRGAVLDTLLADPSLGSSAASSGAGVDFDGGAELGGAENSVASLGLPDLDSEPRDVAPRRRTGDGPKASERILALLNGQAQDSTPAMDLANDYSSVAARTNAPSEPEPEPERTSTATANRLPPAQQIAKDALVQLRKPKVALIVAAVVAVLLLLLLITTGGGEKNTAQNQLLVVTPPPTSAASSASPAPPSSSIIQPKSAESKCPPGSTSGMDAFGGQTGKAWSCVRAYKVDGQVITIDLGKTYQIDSIGIVPGWDHISADGTDQWAKYRTVSRVSYQFDDGNKTVYTQPTLDQRTLVVTKMEPAVSASKIVLTVLESKGDASINTTAIASIVITGH
ncbi:discoidin domain-containing protein [Nocardia sp. NPDC004168]|uniref:discoidin domain-containing protein n=1 Tax=Nocardia sp. NPDC004168 TaxID=3154452 RepID=UPI0033A57F58